ncbi:Protein yippeelike 1, putative [Acanthamoeba castellanii str. Neff]|uniref:Protein yippee-like n=1 Tax=Acanthamoeba castellanii (strain ATCC 30010 / Neff) TaxID=1257118 RepID=L8HJV6_ACACF|nr:Protein yippeelike 1, putative [Acanthamoeba castellanii str. Neff]ELR25490.1 Protein yippeelike 1, putative [Acanthamoeba castellanii str. Neff]
MGKLFKSYLSGPGVYKCHSCDTHLAKHGDIISKAFQSRSGKAYLFDKVVNVTSGPKEDRILITGLHTVADVFCSDCQAYVGWKYEEAFEESQKYKEGKFILEKAKIVKKSYSE